MTKKDFDEFIDQFLYRTKKIPPGSLNWTASLLQREYVDSLSLVLLINEVEMHFEMKIPENQINEKNFASKESLFHLLAEID
ncbi:MAG: acyl carrier protein [Bdellovibrionales bacterium]|nr:acyl carrier protein [Bdellovibrionales bacterium]